MFVKALLVHYIFYRPAYRFPRLFGWWVRLVDRDFGQGGG